MDKKMEAMDYLAIKVQGSSYRQEWRAKPKRAWELKWHLRLHYVCRELYVEGGGLNSYQHYPFIILIMPLLQHTPN